VFEAQTAYVRRRRRIELGLRGLFYVAAMRQKYAAPARPVRSGVRTHAALAARLAVERACTGLATTMLRGGAYGLSRVSAAGGTASGQVWDLGERLGPS